MVQLRMSDLSAGCKNTNLSMSPTKERSYESVGTILNQSDFLSHEEQMLGSELSLTEMSEGEYTHLQHLIQTHMETQQSVSDMPPPDQFPQTEMIKDTTIMSPLSATQAIDLSTSSDGQDVILPGEKTPSSYGEVPGFVFARIRGEESLAAPPANICTSSQTRAHSSARVCLEKRFNSISGAPRQQDLQSAVLSNFLTIVQQSSETQVTSTHSQLHKWMQSDRRNEMSVPYMGMYNPVTNMCGKVISQISHMEPHQSLIIPKGFPLNLCPDRVLAKAHLVSDSNLSEDERISPLAPKKRTKTIRVTKVVPHGVGEAESSERKRAHRVVSVSQRRERHNCKERERRKRIRLCCDELNTLVPFCQTDTDKVTTLQWTAAYLKYINKMYGDTLKEEFQKSFTDENGPNPSSGVDQIHMTQNLDIPLAVEP